MQKIEYSFKAKSEIFHGSFKSGGFYRGFSKEKIIVRESKKIKSKFLPEESFLKRQAIALICVEFWQKIDTRERMSIYDEFLEKFEYSAMVNSKYEFIQQFVNILKISGITRGYAFEIPQILELFDDDDFLSLIRRESKYIVALMRQMKDELFTWIQYYKKQTNTDRVPTSEIETNPSSPYCILVKQLSKVAKREFNVYDVDQYIDFVPLISGNSIRGKLRRFLMHDFCKKVGIDKLSPTTYYQLFSGGVLKDSLEINIDKEREYVKMCPPLRLLGSAMGNKILRGSLIVGEAKLKCKENGNGKSSYHDFMNVRYGSRSKMADMEHIISDDVSVTDTIGIQMMYGFEVVTPGTEWEHLFICTNEDLLIESLFTRMLELFIENPYVGARSNIGWGNIDLTELEQKIKQLPSSMTYLNYLKHHKDEIKEYWENIEVGQKKKRGRKKSTGEKEIKNFEDEKLSDNL